MDRTIVSRWFGDVELTKDLRLLLSIGGLYSLSVALSNTFVNVYLWRQTNNFFLLGLYNLAIVVTQPIFFILAGRLAKQVDRIIVFRLGVLLLAIYYVTVLFLPDITTFTLLIIGVLLGTGYGFYWLAYNVLTFEITEPENRDFFNGFLGMLSSIGGMVGPMVAGFILSRFINTGYTIVFGVSLTLFALASILSFFMKRRPAHGKYFFLRILQERKQNKNWQLVTWANLMQGLREGIFAFIINVYVFLATGSEMALGTFAFINSIVSTLTYLIVSKKIKKGHRKKAIGIGGLMLFFAIFIILLKPAYTYFVIYGITVSLAYPIILVPYLSTIYDVIGLSWKAGEMRIEYIVVRELFLNLGRIISVATFLICAKLFEVEKVVPYLLTLFGAGYSLIYLFVRRIEIKGINP